MWSFDLIVVLQRGDSLWHNYLNSCATVTRPRVLEFRKPFESYPNLFGTFIPTYLSQFGTLILSVPLVLHQRNRDLFGEESDLLQQELIRGPESIV